jgi:hypothetical protein
MTSIPNFTRLARVLHHLIQVKVKENFGMAAMFVFYIKKQLHTLPSQVTVRHFSGLYLVMSVWLTQQPYYEFY